MGVGWKIPEKDVEGNDKTVATMGFYSAPYRGIKIDSTNIYERMFQETLKLLKNMCQIVRGKKKHGPQSVLSLHQNTQLGHISWLGWPMVAGEAQRMGQAHRIPISKDPQLHVKLRYGVDIF